MKMQPWFSSSLKSLLSKLLIKNPKQRLGANGATEVKEHPFFKGIEWNAVLNKEIPPPMKLVSAHKETPVYSKVRILCFVQTNNLFIALWRGFLFGEF